MKKGLFESGTKLNPFLKEITTCIFSTTSKLDFINISYHKENLKLDLISNVLHDNYKIQIFILVNANDFIFATYYTRITIWSVKIILNFGGPN